MTHPSIRSSAASVLQALRRAPAPAAVHALRRRARHALVRLKVLQSTLQARRYERLRRSLRELIRISTESRDAQVHWQLMVELTRGYPALDAGTSRRLLAALESRKRLATLKLARQLRSAAGARLTGQLRTDLPKLDAVQSVANMPAAAGRRYRRALRGIAGLLQYRLTSSGVHQLRSRVRKAATLRRLAEISAGGGAQALADKLDGMQEALGDLHDCMLFARWLEGSTLAAPQRVRSALASLVRHNLRRCRRRRKPLRHAIRGYVHEARRLKQQAREWSDPA